MNLSEQINTIETSINNNIFHLPEEIYNIYGLTSKTSQTFLNNICRNQRVLEIGTFHGASTFAMGYQNGSNILTVDTWDSVETIPCNSQFFQEKLFSDKDHFLKTLPKFNNINYIQGNVFSEEVYKQVINKTFDIIFYDGSHTLEDIISFIMLYSPLFKDCIVIFDDYNFESVRLGIEVAFKELEASYKFKKEILTNGESKNTFWNGMGIFIF